ncbi:hypothetical protein H2O64_20455 [Kordia sp. YSTF-M3]|uniref:TerB family tellurite resistance protein n=1 Tax=Kordia aestuariivivens TaxID=2759037 RepID=A0ABR7QFA1_9FLAO|nr:hypothetical protein [Kordia aestuariivivens]MBC8757056.1 hypothetical protein [Kordia aestuariivivens]
MDSKQHIAIVFYQHLAKLFYAIASIDKKIQKVEVETLKKEISVFNTITNLKMVNADIDPEHHIMATFDLLYFEEADGQTCYDDFIAFKKNYEALFTASLKKEILEISGKIAASFSNLNKSELMLLANLSIEFKKTTP